MSERLKLWLLVPFSVALCLLALATDPTKASDFLDSSIRVNGCSGTVIGRSGKVAIGISAAHCASKEGTVVAFSNRDGTGGNARWVAIDRKKDLSLFKCWSKDVIGVYPVHRKLLVVKYEGCGYPRGKGPEITHLKFDGLHGIQNLPEKRWVFKVEKGKFSNGCSGGGVFSKGALIGVTTHGSKNDKYMFSAPHAQLVSFLEKSQGVTEVPVFGGVNKVDAGEKVEINGLPLDSDVDRMRAIVHILKLLKEQRDELDRIRRTPVRVQVIDPKTGEVLQEKAYPFGTPIKLMLPRAK